MAEPEKRRPGRPRKLKPDEQTLNFLAGLAQIQCTTREAALVLGVTLQTFHTFLDHYKIARETWEKGAEQGKISLRRTQFRLAQTHAGMAIFLGKNYLGQRDDFTVDGTIQHSVTSELAEILRAHDGNSRSIPHRRGNGIIDGSGVEVRSLIPHRERGGGNGSLPEE